MKNKVLRFTTGCVICMMVLAGMPSDVKALPISGVSSAIADTSGVSKNHSQLKTDINEAEQKSSKAATPGAGVSLAMADFISTQSPNAATKVADETVTVEGEVADTGEAAEGSADETATSEYANIGIAQVESYVNVRSEASEDSESLGKLYNGCAATILGTSEDGGWYQINSGSLTGYVKAEYVVVGDEELIKANTRRVATVTTETLFVRALPSQDTDVIGMVPIEEDLTVTDESYVDNWGWVGVSIAEGDGYVSMEFVTLSTEYTLAESNEEEAARLAKEEAERKQAEEAAKQKSSSSSKSSSSGSSSSYSAASGSSGSAVVSFASQFVGNPYVYGGTSLTNGTDCSGFVMSVYANFGVSLPHSSSAMRSCGYAVDVSSMQPGDIVCYSGHVGIYAGNGMLLHASTPSSGIKYSPVGYRPILAVRRIY